MSVCFCAQDWTWYGGICHWSRWMIRLDAPLQHYGARGVLESRETAGLAAQHQIHGGSTWCMVTLTHSQNADTCSQQHGATARGRSQQTGQSRACCTISTERWCVVVWFKHRGALQARHTATGETKSLIGIFPLLKVDLQTAVSCRNVGPRV